MVIYFLLIIVVIVAIIFLVTFIFMALTVFGANKIGYKKTASFLAVIFLTIIFVPIFLIVLNIFKEDKMGKKEIRNELLKSKIYLSEDFEILNQKETIDFDVYRNEIKLKISKNDFIRMNKLASKKTGIKFIIRDSTEIVKNKYSNYVNYDTLKVILNQNQFYYYRAKIGREGLIY